MRYLKITEESVEGWAWGHQFHVVGKAESLPSKEIREIIDIQQEKELSKD